MLGVRLDPDLEHRLESVSRQQGRSKSEIARHAIQAYVEAHDRAFIEEAKRQSLRAAERGWTEEDEIWESVGAWDDENGREAVTRGSAGK